MLIITGTNLKVTSQAADWAADWTYDWPHRNTEISLFSPATSNPDNISIEMPYCIVGLAETEEKLDFDFLANGELLRSNIIQFIESKNISTVGVLINIMLCVCVHVSNIFLQKHKFTRSNLTQSCV